MAQILEIHHANFRQEVIERSMNENVVLFFWAPWCASCKEIGPLMERLSNELDFTLCKVNTEAETMLAEAMRLSSIPDIRIIHQGRIADQVQGAMSETELRSWITPHFKHPIEMAYDEACRMRTSGMADQALLLLDQILASDPKHSRAKLELARCYLDLGDKSTSLQLLQQFQELDDGYAKAQALIKLLSFADLLATPALEHPMEVPFRTALEAALSEQWENALIQLLEIVKVDREFRADGAREAMVTLFQTLGADHMDLVKKFRQRLSMYLFS